MEKNKYSTPFGDIEFISTVTHNPLVVHHTANTKCIERKRQKESAENDKRED